MLPIIAVYMSESVSHSAFSYLLAGPCSAESMEQVWETAVAIQAIAPSAIFRAGLWKPRTSPTAFAGVGATGLPWLMRVQQELGMPVATEIATPEHLNVCIKAGIQHYWIGARTTANPIMMQALADAFQASCMLFSRPITVYVKNPINPDINLWIGAIERLQQAGISEIVAVHRGFSTLYNSEWRNAPMWSLPMELRRRMPHVPVICDPSHIAGEADKVGAIAQEALTIGFDGLMVECHYSPAHALSDAMQQLTPESLHALLTHLNQRKNTEVTSDTTLFALRQQIDEIDDELWQLIAKRLEVAHEIGAYKKVQNMPILQSERYENILQKRIRWAAQHGISEETVRQLMDAIHTESVKQQL